MFSKCKNLKEVKSLYHKLALKNHPDRNPGREAEATEAMKKINAAYDEAVKYFETHAERFESGKSHQSTKTAAEMDAGFKDILNKLLHIPGIIIECCGSWLWISGETKEHKADLKAAGCFWASKKKMWYWREPEQATYSRKGAKSMEYIRSVYGSEIIKESHFQTALNFG